jgi:uncharacterized protein YbjQ (UPF0145 family)
MKNEFIISTTNNIEGCPIKKYIDTICSNIVIGTNIFSDFAASLTDFFGGRSDSYKRKLEIIYNEASKELKQKALNIGANAIIGFKVDFDEISGKDKSMFMVSVLGTACIIEYKNDCSETAISNNIIAQDELDKEIKRRYIISQINHGADLKEQWFEFLLENPQIDIINNLLDRYVAYYKGYDTYKENIHFIEKHLSLLPKDEVIDKVYSKYEANKKEIKALITNCNLFSPTNLLSLCRVDCHLAIDLLLTNTDYYRKEDILAMSEIYNILASLPNTGKIEVVKGGLLGKEQEKFICQNGHKSSPNSEFCENFNCGVNIKGLTKDETWTISKFKQRIDVLNDMMK